MSNMGHCRFENTLGDFLDCLDHASDELSGSEHGSRKELISAAIDFLEEFGADGHEIWESLSLPEVTQ